MTRPPYEALSELLHRAVCDLDRIRSLNRERGEEKWPETADEAWGIVDELREQLEKLGGEK